jgi:hypothetical protein
LKRTLFRSVRPFGQSPFLPPPERFRPPASRGAQF